MISRLQKIRGCCLIHSKTSRPFSGLFSNNGKDPAETPAEVKPKGEYKSKRTYMFESKGNKSKPKEEPEAPIATKEPSRSAERILNFKMNEEILKDSR